ncbi:MAG: hypothetical protein EP305_03955 [Bacteroidetes bacterium]|nr:MAG: hypothetical protein EP305_03955 [Bacteroidota bacterium]
MTKSNRIFFILGYLLLLILVFILPFKKVVYSNGNFGIPDEIELYNAFREYFIIIAQFFGYITLILLGIGINRVIVILAIVTSILNVLSLPLIYFALTFDLSFFGSPKTIHITLGYYLLVLLNLALVFYAFYSYRFYPKASEMKKKIQEDLLDT